MKRVPEPELMDEPEQAKAYAEADFSEPHTMFVERFQDVFQQPRQAARVLDLGCGSADVTVRFARAFPDVYIDGVDGAEAMLALGRAAIAAGGLEARISLHCTRLPARVLPREHYDVLISNSLLHHLADSQVLWDAVKRWSAPGAAVFIMDLMRPQDRAEWDWLVARYAADAPAVLQRDFRASLAAAYRPAEVVAQLACAGLDNLQVAAIGDRHLIVWGRMPAP